MEQDIPPKIKGTLFIQICKNEHTVTQNDLWLSKDLLLENQEISPKAVSQKGYNLFTLPILKEGKASVNVLH